MLRKTLALNPGGREDKKWGLHQSYLREQLF